MDLLFPLAHTQATGLFFLTTLLPLAYWLLRVLQAAQRRRVPGVAWWAVPGWVTLLFAGLLGQPTFLALGAAALLLAEFWPRAYRPAATRPRALWPAFGAVLGLVLLFVTLAQWLAEPQPLALAAALAFLLAGAAGLVAALSWRPLNVRPPRPWPRIARVTVPDVPDLSLSLTRRGAQLQNVSPGPLELAGWSPERINAWLPFKDEHGQRLGALQAGQSAWVPLSENDHGLRVWYYTAASSDVPRLFRADWQPPQRDRVLN